MLILLKTLIDIIALRKGPDSIPASWFVFVLMFGMMILSGYAAVVLIDPEAPQNGVVTFVSYAAGLTFYAAVVYLAGYSSRVLQALSSIIGCGAIITVFYVAAFVLLAPLLGRQAAALVAIMVIFWSVPVEGHIIARAIGRHWYVGCVVAVVACVLQIGLQRVITATG